MARDEYVTISDVEIGEDSDSGLAFECWIEGERLWVPYSQTRARHINRSSKNASSIEVTLWWCEHNNVEHD